jgi:hypothetical protein
VGLTLLGSGILIVLSLAPAAGLFAGGVLVPALSLLAWGGVFLSYGAAARAVRVRTWQGILMPAGAVLFTAALLRSMALALARGGVWWRGTFYPLADLRRGRVR